MFLRPCTFKPAYFLELTHLKSCVFWILQIQNDVFMATCEFNMTCWFKMTRLSELVNLKWREICYLDLQGVRTQHLSFWKELYDIITVIRKFKFGIWNYRTSMANNQIFFNLGTCIFFVYVSIIFKMADQRWRRSFAN